MFVIPKSSMNGSKEVMKMPSRRRSKAQVVIICFSLIVLIFIIHQILSSSNMIWKRHVGVRENNVRNILLNGFDSEDVFTQIRKHPKSQPFHGEKLIHLDLKGAPPLVSYFRKFFPYIKKLGATGVLIEYEDMFFYDGKLEGIRALNAYTPSEIKTILKLAEINDLSVIPLIQTFGHLEFVLKLEKFKDMREVDAFPQVLCPSHERVHFVIREMIDQVMKAHPKSKYIHIGSDEVMYLGRCEKCKTAMHENGWTTSDLFLNHVKSIALYINKTYPGVRPIMWGDMVAGTDKQKLEKSQISSLIDLMVWKYVPNVSDYITDDLLEVYAKLFKNIWIASAFKGATGVSQIVTNAKYHLTNHMAWMDIVLKWKNFINFKGIALTGWQRYDHFATLCELLPVAIPSLTLSMSYINDSGKGFNEQIKILECNSDINSKNERCNFPGFPLYQLVNKFSSFSSRIGNQFSIMSSGWFSVYNIVHKFSNPAYVQNMFDKWPVNEYLNEMYALEEDLRRALSEIYDEHTVKEWITTYVAPLRIRLEAFCSAKETVLEQNVWPRRPLVNNTDDLEEAVREICTFDRKSGCALLLL